MPTRKPLPAPKARHTQRRGDHRRERLLRAATGLIERHPLSRLTYAAVCKRAGVPVGSAHHFYPDLDSIVLTLLDRHRAAKDAALLRPIPSRHRNSWQAVVACLIDRAVRYHRTHPVITRIAIGGDTPPNIKLHDRIADRARAAAIVELLERMFVLPDVPGKLRVAFLATEVVDTALTLSMMESGRLTAPHVRLAKAAAIGLLMMTFGAELPPRAAPAGPATRSRR